MKNWKNLLLAALTVLMLIGFAWPVTSPDITDEAAERHLNLESPADSEDEGEDDAYDFL